MFIEQDNVVAGQETFQDEIGFSLFLLVGTQAFGVAEFGNDSDFERHIVGQSFAVFLSLIHISEPTRQAEISYAVFCLKKKKKKKDKQKYRMQ